MQPHNSHATESALTELDHLQKVIRLFGSIKKKRATEPDDWTKEYDQVEKDYERRMQRTWMGKID